MVVDGDSPGEGVPFGILAVPRDNGRKIQGPRVGRKNRIQLGQRELDGAQFMFLARMVEYSQRHFHLDAGLIFQLFKMGASKLERNLNADRFAVGFFAIVVNAVYVHRSSSSGAAALPG